MTPRRLAEREHVSYEGAALAFEKLRKQVGLILKKETDR